MPASDRLFFAIMGAKVAFAEETVFRGLLQTSLFERLGPVAAIFLTSSGEPVASGGSDSGGSGSSDAGATPPSRDPSGPTEPSSPTVASRAPDATSFYACSSARVASPSSGHWLVTLVVLFVFRRRRSSIIAR